MFPLCYWNHLKLDSQYSAVCESIHNLSSDKIIELEGSFTRLMKFNQVNSWEVLQFLGS
jgi:hypothetical protein